MALPLRIQLQQLYVAYFNRPADVGGLTFWTQQVESGQADLAAVSASFAASAEYKLGYFNLSAVAVVGQIYHNLFGRTPEPVGLEYWSNHLAAGRLTIDRIVKNIADGALGSDQQIFNRKVTAATAFTDALDTPVEIAGYSGAMANQLAADFIGAITDQQSLSNALLPATLPALIASVVQPSAPAQRLTLGQDTLTGGAAIDTFQASAAAGDTLQSGDVINGGSGNGDRLNADISSGQALAVVPVLTSIEQVVLRGIASPATTGPAAHRVVVDATRSNGVTYWESNNSQRDVLIEQVGHDFGTTADVTLAMVGTDAGDVDFGVYFKQEMLSQAVQTNDVLRLQLLDVRSAGAGKGPLQESPYSGVNFFYNGVRVQVTSSAIDAAQNYDELLAAFQVAVAATPGLGAITVSKGPIFTVNIPWAPGRTATGTEILLTAIDGNDLDATGLGAGWLVTSGVVPDAGGTFHTSMLTQANTAPIPRTSSIILDDVGRGGTGGDLVVGAAVTGIERFAIELRDSSKLQTITSTNNTLTEVTISNGMTTSHNSTDVQNRGNLTVLGTIDAVVAGSASEALPGTAAQHNGFGFSDVRLIDASLMGGKINFSAEITAAAIPKYILMGGQNTSSEARNFVYTGGTSDDTMNVTIDGRVLATDTLQARFSAHGGRGNDTISITIVPGTSGQDYYEPVRVEGGAGNDVVLMSGAGFGAIDLGEGDDSFTGTGVGDYVVTGGLGNDRIVLGTALGTTAALSSTNVVSFDAPFGKDVITNFNAGGMGRDVLDFTRIGGVSMEFSGTSVSDNSGSITVQAGNAGNDTLAEIGALYRDFSDRNATHVFITYDTANVGKVYTVVDSAGLAANLVVTLVGSIDLGDTAWSSLTAANFGGTSV